MNFMEKQCCVILLAVGLIIIHLIDESEEQILGKKTSACDGPCGQLSLSCPVGQRIAVRDAAHKVQKRTPLCQAFKGCSQPNQDVCCEQTSQDCSLDYSTSRLKELHRNCSGRNECLLQTERPDLETTKCSPKSGQLLSTQTILTYVCIQDSAVAEICSPTETVIEGRTLFAIMDSRGAKRPSTGSVCTCNAESIKWPTTNTIAVFVIDLRLNVLNSSECSNVSLSVRSGNKNKDLNCPTVGDLVLPFVAVLNNSNVATLELGVNSYLPEFVWIGFESNENEDIRVTCKLQGLLPSHVPSHEITLQDVENILDNDSPKSKKNHKISDTKPVAAIIGGVVAAVVVVVVVVAVIVAIIIRKRKRSQTSRSQPDFDVTYYSTTDETLRNLQSTTQTFDFRKESISVQEMYVSAEEVIANKRKSNPDHVSVANTPCFSVGHDMEYASGLDVLKRKHHSQKSTSRTNGDIINSNRLSSAENNYDRLNVQDCNPPIAILESYDQLEPGTVVWDSYSFASGVKVKKSRQNRLAEISRRDALVGNINESYDDNAAYTSVRTLPVKVSGLACEDYFELGTLSSKGHSNAAYFGVDELPTLKHREKTPGSSKSSLAAARKPSIPSHADFTRSSNSSLDVSSDELYNDAESEPACRKKDKTDVYRANESALLNPGRKADITDEASSNIAGIAAEHRIPVAAPRRKSRSNLA